ncbi:MAG: hypothetical protein HRU27_20795 [Rhizobiaceae bacterium]|nr:hypothetical protein [Rhizobiaceae bacterium]
METFSYARKRFDVTALAWKRLPDNPERFHVEGVGAKRFNVKRFHVDAHAHISADMYVDVETL